MDFKEMNLLELIEFWYEDEKKEKPELQIEERMDLWISAYDAAVLKSSELEMLQALHNLKESEWVHDKNTLKKRFIDCFTADLLEEVKQLKTTVALLLKQHEGEPANISVHELNDLKGGLKR